MHIYRSQVTDFEVPEVDLLTYIFDHPSSQATEDTIIHVEAANPSNRITKGEASILSCQIAHHLRHDFGIGASGPGKDVVLCISSGSPFIPILFYSILAAGGIFSGASTSFTVNELVRQTKTSHAKLLICSPEYTSKTIATAQQCDIPPSNVLVLDHSKPKQWTLHSADTTANPFPTPTSALLPWPRLSPSALSTTPICLLFSSGTTGLPKGVLLSHTNCVAASTGFLAVTAQPYLSQHPPFPYRTIAHLPTAHIGGIQYYCIQDIVVGGTVYWMPSYHLVDFLKYNKLYETTYQFTVPPVWLDIANSDAVTDEFANLCVGLTGSAPMGRGLMERVRRKLGGGEGKWSQTYGTTETCGSHCGTGWGEVDVSGSVGGLIAGMEARLVDEEDRDVNVGERGEVMLRGKSVMMRYFENEEATQEAFLEGQWYRTGDVGVWRDGKLWVVDRKKELIKYKAMQVAPAELEAMLISHEKVVDAAVIGVWDERLQTEVPRAYVVAKRGDVPSAEEIKGFIKDNMATHKQLRGGVVFPDEIPKSASGKILRKTLRELAKEEIKARL